MRSAGIIYVNGKFAAQLTTGVQRVAARLVTALDAQVEAGRYVLLCPPNACPPALRQVEVRTIGPRGLPLLLWEQVLLPWVARDGWLLNLSGSAPALARRDVTLMHDAAVFDHPEAYTRPFVAWYRYLYRRAARRSAGLLTPSAFSRDRLAACLGVCPTRFTVLANGADHLDETRADESVLDRHGLRGVPFVLAVASANPTKNLDALISAFACLRGTLKLVIAGGVNRRVFAKHAAHDVPGVVRTGHLDDTSLVALYRYALAMIFPSVYEGFGLPPLEAMGQGCPVAAARAAAIPEVCGDAALYFNPYDIADIAEALRHLTADASLRSELRATGKARARRFPWSESAARLRGTLQALGAAA